MLLALLMRFFLAVIAKQAVGAYLWKTAALSWIGPQSHPRSVLEGAVEVVGEARGVGTVKGAGRAWAPGMAASLELLHWTSAIRACLSCLSITIKYRSIIGRLPVHHQLFPGLTWKALPVSHAVPAASIVLGAGKHGIVGGIWKSRQHPTTAAKLISNCICEQHPGRPLCG